MMHTKDEIDQFLRRAFFAVLTFPTPEGLTSQLMIFSHTADGDFFLVSQNDPEIFASLADNPEVSVLIYKEEEDLDKIRQLNLVGNASFIKGFDSDEAILGYEAVGEKSPLIGYIPFDEDNRDGSTLIKVQARKISYITFAEIKQQNSPTVLKRS